MFLPKQSKLKIIIKYFPLGDVGVLRTKWQSGEGSAQLSLGLECGTPIKLYLACTKPRIHPNNKGNISISSKPPFFLLLLCSGEIKAKLYNLIICLVESPNYFDFPILKLQYTWFISVSCESADADWGTLSWGPQKTSLLLICRPTFFINFLIDISYIYIFMTCNGMLWFMPILLSSEQAG